MAKMTEAFDFAELQRRMQGAISVFKSELSSLRTGRASASLLDPITVSAYGGTMPLNQLATVNVPEPRLLTVQVWDRALVPAVEKAIRESSLGLNPILDGAVLRLPIPEPNMERRKELVKIAHKYAEGARVAVRHVRRDGMDELKEREKKGMLSEDEARSLSDKIQEATDQSIADIAKMLAAKEQEVMTI